MTAKLTGFAGLLLMTSPWLLAGGCSQSQQPAPTASASARPASAPSASASAPAMPPEPAGGDEIRPVYPVDAGPPDPIAQRLCDAIQALPERRKAECCGGPTAIAALIGGQCVRTLTAALQLKSVTVAPADVDRCVEAMTKATAGCDWVTQFALAMPPECEGVIKGALAEKAPCRSSLECPEGMRCLGLSTVDLGTCGPPRPTGWSCNIAVDMLATYTRQDNLDRTHPECTGYCGRSHCADAVATGGDCTGDLQCGRGRCAAGKCTSAPLPVVGEACTGACAAGARCVKGKCAAPKTEGEACDANEECRGACARADGGTAGKCEKTCVSYAVPKIELPVKPPPPGSRPGGLPPRR